MLQSHQRQGSADQEFTSSAGARPKLFGWSCNGWGRWPAAASPFGRSVPGEDSTAPPGSASVNESSSAYRKAASGATQRAPDDQFVLNGM